MTMGDVSPARPAAALVVAAAVTLTVIGMMLVIGGVLATGLFMPGAVLIAIGMVGFAAAGVLQVVVGTPGTAGRAAMTDTVAGS